MNLNRITNLDELEQEKKRLSKLIDKKEQKLEKSFYRAKKHLRHQLSIPVLIKDSISKIFSLSTLLSHPSAYFQIGSAIGKRLFARKKKI